MRREIAAAALMLAIATGGSATPAAAQERLSLTGAVKRALQSNLDLKRQRLDVPIAQAEIITAGLRPNPQISVNADLLSSRLPVFTPEQKQYGLSLAVPLELGGKRDARISSARSAVALTQAQIAESERQTMLAAANAWFDVAQAKQTLANIERAKMLFDSVVAINTIRLRDQAITPLELRRSQIAADQYALLAHNASIDVAHSRRALTLLLGAGEPVDTDGSVSFAFAPPSLDSTIAHACAARSDVQAAKVSIEAADANRQLQEAIAVPDITVSADYLRQQGTPFYGLSMSVPLPFFSHNQGGIEKAEAEHAQAQYTFDAAVRQAEAEVRSAYEEYRARIAMVERYTPMLAESETVLNTVQYAYRTGNTTILDLLDAQRTWFELRQAYDDAVIAAQRSAATLAITSGLFPDA
ncbi:MAG: TolC family protein [Bacteroidetes bacterium]|nr:TolC family protein [Bacteroidota bacterium]